MLADGLLDTGELVGRDDFIAGATKAADALMNCVSPSGRLWVASTRIGRLERAGRAWQDARSSESS
jgi:hypothetical protein